VFDRSFGVDLPDMETTIRKIKDEIQDTVSVKVSDQPKVHSFL
jgi:hypothetical protein